MTSFAGCLGAVWWLVSVLRVACYFVCPYLLGVFVVVVVVLLFFVVIVAGVLVLFCLEVVVMLLVWLQMFAYHGLSSAECADSFAANCSCPSVSHDVFVLVVLIAVIVVAPCFSCAHVCCLC